jgi:hypothetical protein
MINLEQGNESISDMAPSGAGIETAPCSLRVLRVINFPVLIAIMDTTRYLLSTTGFRQGTWRQFQEG